MCYVHQSARQVEAMGGELSAKQWLGLMISINSNGSLLKEEILDRFLKDPPFWFNISLYGGSNETYANMCGLPVYDQVKENIRALRKAGVAVSLNQL